MNFAIRSCTRMALLGVLALGLSLRAFAVDYPSAVWKPAAVGNYETGSGRSTGVRWIILHTTEGSTASAVATFQDPNSNVSAHYIVSRDGSVIQMVLERDVAYAAGNYSYNVAGINIECERSGTQVPTAIQYQAVADLVTSIRQRYSVPLLFFPTGVAPASPSSGSGIIGHINVPDPTDATKGGGISHHTDPVNWDWAYFETLFGSTAPKKPANPSPANGATQQARQLTLSWSNGGGATSYAVYFGTDSTPDSTEAQGTRTTTSFATPTLAYGTTYYWRVDAINSAGTTPGDIFSFTTAAAPITTPSCRTDVATVTATTATLNGTVTDAGGGPIAERRFEWAKDSGNWGAGAPGVDFGIVPDADIVVNGSQFSATVSGLQPGTVYKYRCYVRNAQGFSNPAVTNIVNFTTVPPSYSIALSASPASAGSVAGGGMFVAGANRTVSAISNSGFAFVNWTEGGAIASSSATYTFTVQGNRSLVANFQTVPLRYTITPSAGPNGGVTPDSAQVVNGGESASFTAAPASGYVVDQWFVNGVAVQGGGGSFTLVGVQADASLLVSFKLAPPPPVISGRVTRADNGAGLDGVTIRFANGGGSTVTAGGGFYAQSVPPGYTGVATPAYAGGGAFTPQNLNFALDGYEGAGAGDFQWMPPQSNDRFAAAVTLSGSSAEAVSRTIDATKEKDEPKHAGNPGGHSVWWKWTAHGAGMVTVDTSGSDFDTLLAIYTGEAVDALTEVVSNNDLSESDHASQVSFSANAGTTYYIAVDGVSGASGNAALHLSFSPNTVNLVPFQPADWSDKLVIAVDEHSTSDATELSLKDELFLSWAVENNGNSTISTVTRYQLSVDGVARESWLGNGSMPSDSYEHNIGFPLGTLAVGTHTVTIAADIDAALEESDETDNTYTKTFEILPPIDTDQDGLDDHWELHHFPDLASSAAWAAADSDGDGITNREEYERGTDPDVPDASSGQPDALIGLSSRTMIGANVFDRFGTGESIEVSARRGHSKTAIIYLQNKSGTRETIHVRGAGDSPQFRVRYIYSAPFGAIDVTKGVERGTFQLKNLPAGARRILKAIVLPRGLATAGDRYSVGIDVWAEADPSLRDRVIFSVQAK